jgi:predicted AAA+ superfamily ATPase
MPMSFRDYVRARDPRIEPSAPIALWDFATTDAKDALQETALRTAALTQFLEEYARSGGLPAPVADMIRNQSVDPAPTLGLWRGLAADIRRLDRNETRLEKLLARVVVALTSTSDDADVAKQMGASKPTASDYIGLLAQSFALIAVHQPDPKRQGGPSLTKPRKLYFGDPAFAAIPRALQGGPEAKISDLVENVLAIALFREAENDALLRYREPSRVFFWRSSDGREIDFLVPLDRGRLAIESKFARDMTGKDYESMEKAFGGGIMVSKNELILDRKVLTVPAGVFLAHLA